MNARSISGTQKLKEFNIYFAERSEADIICLTETWLSSQILDSEILDQKQYSVFRKDRGENTRGGGVLIAINSSLISRQVEGLACSQCEIIWTEVSLASNHSLYIGCVYLPPIPSSALVSDFLNSVSQLMTRARAEDVILLSGDFNLPDISWLNALPTITGHTNTGVSHEFLDGVHELNIFQTVHFPTRENNFLDLLFCNSHDVPVITNRTETAVHTDHSAFEATISLPILQRAKTKPIPRFNWKKADLKLLNRTLQDVLWAKLDDLEGVNDKCDEFYTLLNNAISETVPIMKVNPYKYPVWFNKELIKALKEKNRSHKRWKRTRLMSEYVEFQVKRSFFKVLKNITYQSYLKTIDSEVACNPNLLWKYVKSKSRAPRVPIEVELDSIKSSNPKESCQLFSKFFASTFQPANIQNNNVLPKAYLYDNDCLHTFKISSSEVEHYLSELVNGKSPGPDGIPTNVLKFCSRPLSVPLSKIFNHALKTGIFPTRWKHSHVTPVHKKGSRFLVSNYRPISLLAVFSKIFEKILHKNIYEHVAKHIATEQHGFVKKRSTVTNLVEYTSTIADYLNQKIQVDSIYTDFSKAFDSVDHQLLIHKLEGFNITGELLSLLKNYLTNRTQSVVMNAVTSSSIPVTSGVPQGSILGPLFFVLFVNDIPNQIKSKCLLYADDLKIYKPVNSERDCEDLQIDITNIVNWCNTWKLELNVSKCFSITFTNKRSNFLQYDYKIDNTVISRTNIVKDLGVHIASDLNYNVHFSYIKSKAYKLLGLMRRNCFTSFSKNTNKLLYSAIVRPQIEYASIIWNPHHKTKINSLERVQKRFINLQCFYSGESYEENDINYFDQCQRYNLSILRDRRMLLDMVFLFKLLNGFYNTPLVTLFNFYIPNHVIRSKQFFRVSSFRIDICKFSSINRLQMTYNFLFNKHGELDINFNTLQEFKRIIRTEEGNFCIA